MSTFCFDDEAAIPIILGQASHWRLWLMMTKQSDINANFSYFLFGRQLFITTMMYNQDQALNSVIQVSGYDINWRQEDNPNVQIARDYFSAAWSNVWVGGVASRRNRRLYPANLSAKQRNLTWLSMSDYDISCVPYQCISLNVNHTISPSQ